jgi:hypothetical protein
MQLCIKGPQRELFPRRLAAITRSSDPILPALSHKSKKWVAKVCKYMITVQVIYASPDLPLDMIVRAVTKPKPSPLPPKKSPPPPSLLPPVLEAKAQVPRVVRPKSAVTLARRCRSAAKTYAKLRPLLPPRPRTGVTRGAEGKEGDVGATEKIFFVMDNLVRTKDCKPTVALSETGITDYTLDALWDEQFFLNCIIFINN